MSIAHLLIIWVVGGWRTQLISLKSTLNLLSPVWLFSRSYRHINECSDSVASGQAQKMPTHCTRHNVVFRIVFVNHFKAKVTTSKLKKSRVPASLEITVSVIQQFERFSVDTDGG